MPKTLKHSLKHTLSTVALGAMVQSSGTQAQAQTPISVEHYQAKTPISVEHYKKEIAKIFAGQSLAGQSNTPTTHIGGIFPTGENSLVAGQFEKGKHTSKITLATGGASDNVYGGIAVSGAKQNNLKGGKISGIVGITNGDIGANIEASSERGKSGKPTFKTQTLGRNWKEETPTEIHNFNETTHITQTQQIEGKSRSEIHVRVTKTLSEHVQGIVGIVHTTGSAVPEGHNKIAGEAGVNIKWGQGKLRITGDTSGDITGGVNYDIGKWGVYAGGSYNPKQGEKSAHVGFGYSFGGGNNRGTTPSTPTRNNFGAHKEMEDHITGLLAGGVSDLSNLVEQRTRTIVTQKVTKHTTTKPTLPTTPETPKETKIPKDFPTLEEKPTFSIPKPLVPQPEGEVFYADLLNPKIILPEGYTLDMDIIKSNSNKLRGASVKSDVYLSFDYNKETRTLHNMYDYVHDRAVTGTLYIPLKNTLGEKITYELRTEGLGHGSSNEEFEDPVYEIKTQN